MSVEKPVIAFDLYGTLLSTESIKKALAEHMDDDAAKQVAALWRRYQLEYTWRLNSMGGSLPPPPQPCELPLDPEALADASARNLQALR